MYFIKTLVNLHQTYVALVDDGYYVNMQTTHYVSQLSYLVAMSVPYNAYSIDTSCALCLFISYLFSRYR